VTKETSATVTPLKAVTGEAREFPKTARILRRAEFRHVYDNGFRISGPVFTAFCFQRPEDGAAPSARLGITVPRAVGGAVERNRIKRRLREAFRLHRAELDKRWDVVLNPRRSALHAEFQEIERSLRQVIEKCNSRS
jgi:ribonuclease P protein component